MKMRKDIMAAVLLSLGSATVSVQAAEPKAEEKCYGINKCQGHSKCGVSKGDIEASKEAFGQKFAKSATHDCAGHGSCGAAQGQLGWVSVPEGTCIKKEKGFLIKDQGGKKVVVK